MIGEVVYIGVTGLSIILGIALTLGSFISHAPLIWFLALLIGGLALLGSGFVFAITLLKTPAPTYLEAILHGGQIVELYHKDHRKSYLIPKRVSNWFIQLKDGLYKRANKPFFYKGTIHYQIVEGVGATALPNAEKVLEEIYRKYKIDKAKPLEMIEKIARGEIQADEKTRETAQKVMQDVLEMSKQYGEDVGWDNIQLWMKQINPAGVWSWVEEEVAARLESINRGVPWGWVIAGLLVLGAIFLIGYFLTHGNPAPASAAHATVNATAKALNTTHVLVG